MRHAAERDGEPPIYRLERGQITESEFMDDAPDEPRGRARARRRPRRLRRAADGRAHPERAAAGLLPRRCASAACGWRSAPTTCANGSTAGARRRSTTLFELVVDSGFEGTRKPEPEIYEIVLAAARSCPRRSASSSTTSRSTSTAPAKSACTASTSATPPRPSRRSTRSSSAARSAAAQFSLPSRSQT